MPDGPAPPEVDLFTRYVLENPYPLMILLLAGAAGAAWMGLRDGRRGPLKISLVCAAAGMAVLLTGLSVTTSAEHGKAVTRAFVEAVVDNDVAGAMNLVSADGSVAVGSPQNPGRSVDFFRDRLTALNLRYPIERNRITSLKGYSESATRAEIHLACSTAAGGYGDTPSRWVLHVEREGDGEWRIVKITAISIAMRRPDDRLW